MQNVIFCWVLSRLEGLWGIQGTLNSPQSHEGVTRLVCRWAPTGHCTFLTRQHAKNALETAHGNT